MVFNSYLEKRRVNAIKVNEEFKSLRKIKMATQEKVLVTFDFCIA